MSIGTRTHTEPRAFKPTVAWIEAEHRIKRALDEFRKADEAVAHYHTATDRETAREPYLDRAERILRGEE